MEKKFKLLSIISGPAKFIFFLLIIGSTKVEAQNFESAKCGAIDSEMVETSLRILGDHWGYSYQDLIVDLGEWSKNSFIDIDSIGKSVEGLNLWQLKITDPSLTDTGKKVIFIHARTHPIEVQSTYVCNEMIEFLISDIPEAKAIRESTVFYFVPMLNPDGVEFEYPRKNANGIDLESNWFSPEIQPEVISIRRRFLNLMNSQIPVELALNMHSAFACKRYFVYHHENGTSHNFTQMEKEFINGVRDYYPEGIEAWNYYVSWTTGTPFKYPESWWWLNYGEKVMALTYEDMNCDISGNYDRTARAIILGIMEYLDITLNIENIQVEDDQAKLFQNYPNPLFAGKDLYTIIEFKKASTNEATLSLYNMYGTRIMSNSFSESIEGYVRHKMDISLLNPGIYFYQLKIDNHIFTKKMIIN